MRSNGDFSNDISLYSLTISDEFAAPVFKLLTEIRNPNFLSFWLKEFLRLGGSVPNEFCLDTSSALLNAAVCALTNYSSVLDYTDALFAPHFDANKSIPVCYIHIDVKHLLKNVAASKHFANSEEIVRNTYIKCVALLQKETEVQNVRSVVFNVLLMTFCSTEGENIEIMCSLFGDIRSYIKFCVFRKISFNQETKTKQNVH